MDPERIKPYLEYNLIVPRDRYLRFKEYKQEIEDLLFSDQPIPANLLIALYFCVYDKEAYLSTQIKSKIVLLVGKAIDFFSKQDRYNFNGTYDYNAFYDDFESPFVPEKRSSKKKKKVYTESYSLKKFCESALSDYFYIYDRFYPKEKKGTQQRDNIIRFFYDQLLSYISKINVDPLKSDKGIEYKKKVVATYLTHLVCPIKLLKFKNEIACPYLFRISQNAFKGKSPNT